MFGETVSEIKKRMNVGLTFNKLLILSVKDIIILSVIILIISFDVFPTTIKVGEKKEYNWSNIGIITGIVFFSVIFNRLIDYFMI